MCVCMPLFFTFSVPVFPRPFFLFFLTFGKCEKKRAEDASEQGGGSLFSLYFQSVLDLGVFTTGINGSTLHKGACDVELKGSTERGHGLKSVAAFLFPFAFIIIKPLFLNLPFTPTPITPTNTSIARMPSPLSAAASLALMALVALLSVSTFSPAVVDATALTYNVAAHERACFYAWNDIPKKKIAFYFAVRTFFFLDLLFS